MSKYVLTSETRTNVCGVKLYRIKSLITGDLGGFIESENNLSQEGTCWVGGDAEVWGRAFVHGDAQVYGNARVSNLASVVENAQVYGNSQIVEKALISQNAHVFGSAWIRDRAQVGGNAEVSGNALVLGTSSLSGNDKIEHAHQVVNIANLTYNITVTPQAITIGCHRQSITEWLRVTPKQAKSMGLNIRYFNMIREIIRWLAAYVQEEVR